MVLKAWWMIFVWVTLAAVWYCYVRFLRKRKQSSKHHTKASPRVPVAHSERLTLLPQYQAVLRRYHMYVIGLLTSFAILFLLLIVLSTRPAAITVEQPDLHNRDIMLCLDVSGSMLKTDGSVLETFKDLAKDFKGERLGLTVFDSSSNSIFPLTDDYDFVKDQLKEISDELAGDQFSRTLYQGTSRGQGSSLIGDGLASCVLRFDNLDSKRSRSVILVTDNYANGAQIVTLTQAGGFAKEKGVRVYGINPSDFSSEYYTDKNAEEFHDVVLGTGGGYYKVDYTQAGDTSVVRGIVGKISDQEATRYKGAPRVVQNDNPAVFILVALAMLAIVCGIAWRIER